MRPMTHFAAIVCLACTPWAAYGQGPPQAEPMVPQAQIDPAIVRVSVTEAQDLRFIRRLRREGLSQQRVTHIVQDDRGFLWFGTQYGLNRYDGYSFKVFKNDPDDPQSLCEVDISALFKDRAGALWIGCDYSLDRYDPSTDTFAHYPIDTSRTASSGGTVRHISQDHAGFLWLSTANGLYQFDPRTGRASRFEHSVSDPLSLSSNDVKSSGEDRRGTFWVASSEGLDAFDHGRVTLHVPLREPRDLSFFEDQSGVFWILYASGNGLAVLDRDARRLTRYSFGRQDLPEFPLTGVSSMLEEGDGTLWIGTFSDGLLKFDRAHRRFTRYRNDPANGESLPENRITTLFEDRERNVWAGFGATEPGFFTRPAPSFAALPLDSGNPANLGEALIGALYEDHAGMLWIGTTGALDRLDRNSGRYTHFDIPGNGIASDVLAIAEDRSGALWIGTSGQGLYKLDTATGRMTAFRRFEGNTASPNGETVVQLLVDHAGRLWVSTIDGLYLFDSATGRFTNYRRRGNDPWASFEPIVEDDQGRLWLAAKGTDVLRLDPASGEFTTIGRGLGERTARGAKVLKFIRIDHSGAIWVGTQNGLDRFEPSTQTFTHFSEKDGLASNAVSCMLEDMQGALWIGTSKGLSRLDAGRKSFKNFTQADGLPGPDLTGWSACFRSPSGEMYFGGFAGGVAFRPENITDSSYVPPLVLTAFQLSGRAVGLGPRSPLTHSIDYTNNLSLSHREYGFSFEFSALSFRNPETNRYRYKLEGLDDGWREVGSNQRFATYTTLPAGTYRFRVQGATSRGPWSEPGRTVSITIEPAWWNTWWFRTLAGVLSVLLMLGIYLSRVRQIARQFELRLAERLGERERIARDLHDTLLQGVQGLILRFQAVAQRIPESEPARDSMEQALDRADQVLGESRDRVKDLRSHDGGGIDLPQALAAEGERLAVVYPAQFRPSVEGARRYLHPIVREEVLLIASEALSNAFRHARAQHIEAEVSYGEAALHVRVRDDGQGIGSDVLHEGGRPGHFGLVGMRERAEKIRARLDIWSKPSAGTEIDLRIPAEIAYRRSQGESRGRRLWRKLFRGSVEPR